MFEAERIYVVDASIWISIHRNYPFDVAPGLWDLLNGLIASGRILSPTEVREEIASGTDELKAWSRAQPALYVELSPAEQALAADVLADCPELIDPDSEKPEADPFVVALGQSRGATVVTGERKKGPPCRQIEDVCEMRDVRCVAHHLDWFRELGIRLYPRADLSK